LFTEVLANAIGSRAITTRRIAGLTIPLPRPRNARARMNCHSSVDTAHVKAAMAAMTMPDRTMIDA
jgi:hypothetical protein